MGYTREDFARVTTIPCEVFKRPVYNHSVIQGQLLQAIQSMGINSISDEGQKITHTDWNIPLEIPRPYTKLVQEVFDDHFRAFAQEFHYTECDLVGYWFQQYAKGDFHSVHCHAECNLSSIYYVTLTAENPKTTFIYRDQEYAFDIREGDMITFPSFLRHQSPPNQSDQIKTVISMNVNVI